MGLIKTGATERKNANQKKPKTKDPFAVLAGGRIKAAREGRNLTLVKLAEETGGALKDRAISNYEQGTRLPGPKEALVLARALGESAAYLLGVAEEDQLTDQQQKLLRAFGALPEKDRNEFLRQVTTRALSYIEPVSEDRVESSYGKPNRPFKKKTRIA